MDRRLERFERRRAALTRRSDRFSTIRGWVAIPGVLGAAALVPSAGWVPALWALLAVGVVFGTVVLAHDRLDRRRHALGLWIDIIRELEARRTLDWAGIPSPPPREPDAAHPFERDLNITGPRSLHALLDTAASREGSDRLRRWLLEPEPEDVRERQARVRELAGVRRFRERLMLAGRLLGEEHWDDASVKRWLARSKSVSSPIVLWCLALTNLALAAAGSPLVVATLLVYGVAYWSRLREIRGFVDEALELQAKLEQFGAVAGFLEAEAPRVPVRGLCAPFVDPERSPSAHLRAAARIAMAASAHRTQIVGALLNLVVPWGATFAWRLEREKERLRDLLPAWLEVWHELEALCSLATYAAQNPNASFPDLAEGEPVFEAEGLGHPLLPPGEKVHNDFRLARPGELVIVTGSNMSGKSVFLRTLGVNLRLALCGGPVDARRLRTIPFRVFTCMNVEDTIGGGMSLFYAEVRRLRAMLDALERPEGAPVFYLIDEIFKATNNRERLIGSRSYAHAVAGRRGVGAITTHDLDLVTLANGSAPIDNYHFRDDVADGKMVFDYKLRAGPCPTTNALKLMRREGLPVEE